MKKLLKYSGLMFFWLLICAPTCQDNRQGQAEREQTKIDLEREKLFSDLGADSLSASSLQALENAAIQKLADVSDYLKLYDDVTTDSTFRDKAREMILDRLMSKEISFLFPMERSDQFLAVPVVQFLAERNQGLPKILAFSVDSIRIDTPFTRINDSTYCGKLRFHQKSSWKGRAGNMPVSEDQRTIEIFAVKQNKFFGKEKGRIWETFLGNMK